MRSTVSILHYSDLLCIWAYVSEIRLDELRRTLGPRTTVERRLFSVFGDTATKIGVGWAERGGFEGYASHMREVAAGFSHVSVHPHAWTQVRPTTSLTVHALLKAADGLSAEEPGLLQPVEAYVGRTPLEEFGWQLRLAFFRDGRDISRVEVGLEVAAELGLPIGPLRERLNDGSAWAALSADLSRALSDGVHASPCILLDDRRQVLTGNVSYRVLEANVLGLLDRPGDRASWC
jgi:predicted DsbA family dithiol-disulfide isomerase